MIGGAPVFMPAMQYAPQPGHAVPRQQPAQPQVATGAPVYRGAMPKEQPRPQPVKALAPLRIPTPEELGVAARAKTIAPSVAPVPTAATAVPVARREPPLDWAVVRHKLQDMRAVSFRLDNLPAGRVRFSIWMKATDTPIQADGSSEGEAVRGCLERAKTQFAMGK